ncbi:MAG: METTL5 family protein [Candidatus Woesearchaeota archaeon]
MNKKQLAILLSQLKTFKTQDISLEQYPTECEIAAESLWFAYMQSDIKNKIIADLGCGNGIFGIGSLILGAKQVIFLDIDKEILKIANENLKFIEKKLNKKFDAIFINKHIKDFHKKIDVIIQNPPFGVKNTHADKLFLLISMENSNKIYSFHKIESQNFIEQLSQENGFKAKKVMIFNFPLKKTLFFHTKRVYYVKVGFWKIERFKK